MDANVLAMLCYIAAFFLSWIWVVKWVAWAAPLIIFFVEKESPFVKFHAMQAFLLEAVLWVVQLIFSIIIGITTVASAYNMYSWGSWRGMFGVAGVFGILNVIVWILLAVVAVITLIKAYNYYEYKIPVIGDLAMKISRKGNTPS